MTSRVLSLLIGLSLTVWGGTADAHPDHVRYRPAPRARELDLQRIQLASKSVLHPRRSPSWLGKQRSPAEQQLAKLKLVSDKSAQLDRAQARALIDQAQKKLGAEFELQWQNDSTAIGHRKGQPIVVSRGLVQKPGMTADALALILAHEAAHAHGKGNEASADYWAARYGLRQLWGEGFSKQRALRAAFATLRAEFKDPFDIHHEGHQTIEISATGYPTTQSRWDLYKRGALGWKRPRVGKMHKNVALEYLTCAQAAKYLGISDAALTRLSTQQRGPSLIQTAEGPEYLKQDLDRFR